MLLAAHALPHPIDGKHGDLWSVEVGVDTRAHAEELLMQCGRERRFPEYLNYIVRNHAMQYETTLDFSTDLSEYSRKGWVEFAVGELGILTGITHVVNYTDTREQVQRALRACVVCGINNARYRCDECKSTCYCCAEHQALDWPQHKTVCNRRESKVLADITRLVGSHDWEVVYSVRWGNA